MNVEIRKIQPEDNTALANIIRRSLEEFGANKPGTAYYDESIDHLSDSFTSTNRTYFVALTDGKVVGGGGIFPTKGLPKDTCELVKMYISQQARGLGIGKKIIQHCMQAASDLGYKKIYLETMDELSHAARIYEKLGFQRLIEPLGDSGHFNCKIWMLKDIKVPLS